MFSSLLLILARIDTRSRSLLPGVSAQGVLGMLV